LDGIFTVPVVSGRVPGYLLNPYSIDYVDGLLRVATTIRNRWFIDVVFAQPIPTEAEVVAGPLPEVPPEAFVDGTETSAGESSEGVATPTDTLAGIVGDFVFLSGCPSIEENDECFDEESLEKCTELLERGCNNLFYSSSRCPYTVDCLDIYENSNCKLPSSGDPCLNGKNFATCIDLELGGCQSILVLESCPLQFGCENEVVVDPWEPPVFVDPWEPPASMTENYIYVLKASDGSELQIVGNVTLGKPNEGKLSCMCGAPIFHL
jgi:hypothetical protein